MGPNIANLTRFNGILQNSSVRFTPPSRTFLLFSFSLVANPMLCVTHNAQFFQMIRSYINIEGCSPLQYYALRKALGLPHKYYNSLLTKRKWMWGFLYGLVTSYVATIVLFVTPP